VKIDRLRIHRFEMDLDPPIADARNVIGHRTCVLLELGCEGGISGWGEAAAFAGCQELVVHTLDFLGRRLVGEDATMVGALHDRLMTETLHFGRRGLVINAISAIDCALWDALGKACGQPVARLLGASRERINTYFNAGYYPADDADPMEALERSVADAVERGTRGVKIKIGRYRAKDDAERIRRGRAIVGPDRDLMVDANSCLTRTELAAVDEACVEHGVRWIEEPVPLASLDVLREVRRRTRSPIAGYELEMTLQGYAPLIEQHIVDVVQPDTIWSGGITTCSRIASVACAHSVELIPHNFASVVALASNAHLAAAAPTGGWLELDSNDNPFLWELDASGAWVPDGGVITIPSAPGLGVEPDLSRLERYRVS
jgi:D-galactarolactone cycloisomerase